MRDEQAEAGGKSDSTANHYKKYAGDEIDHTYKPLIVRFTPDGSKYLRFILWNQFWISSNNFSGGESLQTAHFLLRRTRLLMYTQVSPRFLLLTHIGLNNLGSDNLTALGNEGDGPQFFLHDVWGEFKITEGLYAGAGLHYWKGLTRLSSQSTLNFTTLDQTRPFVHWHSLGVTDQFARHLGVYAKGHIGQLEYRFALNNPLNPDNALGQGMDFGALNSDWTYTGSAVPNAQGRPVGRFLTEGYVKYDLLEREEMALPYYPGTYLGTKKVLAIGSGFFVHPNAMYDSSARQHGHVAHLAADVYFDHPVPGGGLNLYASYLHFNYQRNYVSRWSGTGSALYAHAGYFIEKAKIMPYIAWQWADYQGYTSNVSALDAGINYLINGHNAKITLEYHSVQNQPSEGGLDVQGNPLGVQQIRLQVHVFL